jgi:hypothetical protein
VADEKPQSPLWWVKRLKKRLDDRYREIEEYDAYYRGDPKTYPWLPEQARDEFARLLKLTRSNYMGLVVDATAERLQVEGSASARSGPPTRRRGGSGRPTTWIPPPIRRCSKP